MPTLSRVFRESLIKEHGEVPALVCVNLLHLETQGTHAQLPVVFRFQLLRDGNTAGVACWLRNTKRHPLLSAIGFSARLKKPKPKFKFTITRRHG